MTTVETQVIVTVVPFATILDDPSFPTLLRAYAEECSVPDAEPQRAIYAAMEQAKVLCCFTARAEPDNLLIGFVSVLTTAMPHGGRLATVESLFVDPSYRSTGAANLLLDAAERHAQESNCSSLACLARVGSAFEKVLSRRAGYTLTHSQHTRRLT